MRTVLRFVLTFFLAGAGLAVGLVVLAPQMAGVADAGRAGAAPDVTDLQELAQRSLVYDREGKLLAVLHDEENRSPISLDDVPDHLVRAVLDTEDSRFWDHGGIDVRGALRALMTNVSSGEVRQGGSTITQQLVKNALLTPEQSLERKLKEAVLARRLEEEMSKDEILERYLNTVYFGNSAYGVQAAAETYFGIDAASLDVAQSAFLAGLIRNPVGYDPLKFPELARQRRDLAVRRMVEMGDLTPAEAERITATPIPTELSKPLPPPTDYFVETVKQTLLDDTRLGETAQERYNAVFRGGLRITTTLDPRLQQLALEKVNEILPDTKGRFTSSVASVEPDTGAVRAIVGGQDFLTEQYNLATQGLRQPGSSFKTFVLAAAIENGFSAKDTINGRSPCSFKLDTGETYTPGNYEGSKGGVMSLADATAKSINCAYVRLGQAVGLDKVVDTAKSMGITSPLDSSIFSLPLGSMEVTPLDMASAYATLANDGVYKEPYFIEKVQDRSGKKLFTGEHEGKRAISVQTARVVTQVLEGVVQKGTGTRARLPDRRVAGKTGTAQEHTDAWFVGYTPQLSTAVWMGSPTGKVPMRNVGGIRVTGGSYPARIWRAFMVEALEGQPVLSFTAPDPKLIPKAKTIKDTKKSTTATTTRRRRTTATTARSTATTSPDEPPPTSPPPTDPPVTSPPPTSPPEPSG